MDFSALVVLDILMQGQVRVAPSDHFDFLMTNGIEPIGICVLVILFKILSSSKNISLQSFSLGFVRVLYIFQREPSGG